MSARGVVIGNGVPRRWCRWFGHRWRWETFASLTTGWLLPREHVGDLWRCERCGCQELRRSPISAAEFERQYAQRSGVTVEWLRAQGRVVRACDCGDESCEGWRSVSREAAEGIDDPAKPWA